MYKVLIVGNKNRTIPATENLLEKLATLKFETSRAYWADPNMVHSKIEIGCTIDAAKKAKEIKDILISIYKNLGLKPPEIDMRYGIEDANNEGEREKFIRIYF